MKLHVETILIYQMDKIPPIKNWWCLQTSTNFQFFDEMCKEFSNTSKYHEFEDNNILTY